MSSLPSTRIRVRLVLTLTEKWGHGAHRPVLVCLAVVRCLGSDLVHPSSDSHIKSGVFRCVESLTGIGRG